MKYLFLVLFAFCFTVANAQTLQVPSVTLKDVKGNTINTANLTNDGKPVIISFWATWCKPCIQELMAIHENYEDWEEATGLKVIAVSIDDARNSTRVSPFVNSKGWEFEVLLDENSDFKRAMNVNNVPHTFLLDGKGNIVYQHNSYSPGDEDALYEKIKNVAAGKPVGK